MKKNRQQRSESERERESSNSGDLSQDEQNNNQSNITIKKQNQNTVISIEDKEYILTPVDDKACKVNCFSLSIISMFVLLFLLFSFQQVQITKLQADVNSQRDEIDSIRANTPLQFYKPLQKIKINQIAQKFDSGEIGSLKNDIEKIRVDNIRLKMDLESQIRKRVQKRQLFERLADLRNDLAVHRQKNETIITPKGTVSEVDLTRRFNGLKIEQHLYPLVDRQKRREYFNFKRQLYNKNKFYNKKETPFNYVDLSQYDQDPKKNQDTLEYDKLNSIYKLDEVKEELPMCLLVSSYNNEAYFKAELNLNSIFQQNYTNYMAIIFNDKSTDRSNEIYLRYFEFYNISKNRYIYFNSHMKKDNIENFYYAGNVYCSENSIMVHIDGDDELLGKNVLKVLNSVYQKQKPGFVYSLKHSVYNLAQKWFKVGDWPAQYTDQQKKKNIYREVGMRYFHLRSYQSSLFRKLKLEDMMEDGQHFFEISYDYVLFMPLVELSCGRLAALDYNNYMYNVGTGFGEAESKYNRQQQVQGKVLKSKKYTCDPSFAGSKL